MPYRFRRKETVSDGFRRITNEQTAAIVSALADGAEDPADRVHDARRRLKRLRALLELVGSQMDDDLVTREQIAYRNLSRKLGLARDADVALETFDELAIEVIGPIDAMRDLLVTASQRQRKRTLSADKLAALAAQIRVCSHTLVKQKIADDGWDSIALTMGHSYQKARDAYRAKADKQEAMHDWRKFTKTLMYQLTLIRKAAPKPISKLIPQLARLAELLGHFQDLHVLQRILSEHAAHGLQMAKFPTLEAIIEKHRKRALKRAQKLGKKVFAIRPKDFANQLRRGCKAWRRG